MRFLETERHGLEAAMPGLDAELANHSLMTLEHRENPGLDLFRKAGGAGALVPAKHGGLGLSALDALRCTRALGARSPSLGVAATMHNFSVASLVALAEGSDGFEWLLLDAIARDGLLLSSAFAEGRSGQNILRPSMHAVRAGGRWLVSGHKRPCSLSRSMAMITASVDLARDGGEPELGIALIPATQPGITVRPFWNGLVLTGAESDELILDEVPVEDDLMVRPRLSAGTGLDDLQTVGMIWFSLLITGCYLGVASALGERLVSAGRGSAEVRARVCGTLDSAMLAMEQVAYRLDSGRHGNADLARALAARYTAQDLIGAATASAVEALGGMAFIDGPDIGYLSAATSALAFHPPSRAALADALADSYAGAELRVGP